MSVSHLRIRKSEHIKTIQQERKHKNKPDLYSLLQSRLQKRIQQILNRQTDHLLWALPFVLGFIHDTFKWSELTGIISIIQFRDAFDLAVLDRRALFIQLCLSLELHPVQNTLHDATVSSLKSKKNPVTDRHYTTAYWKTIKNTRGIKPLHKESY